MTDNGNKPAERDRVPQMKFEFHQWKEVFKTWRENLALGYDMQLVISTHPYTSGYWIEYRGSEVTPGDHVYTGKRVDALEKRIIAEHKRAAKKERGIKSLIL
jgi:hypothetical protein